MTFKCGCKCTDDKVEKKNKAKYEEAVEAMKKSGRFAELGFETDEEIDMIHPEMVIKALEIDADMALIQTEHDLSILRRE